MYERWTFHHHCIPQPKLGTLLGWFKTDVWELWSSSCTAMIQRLRSLWLLKKVKHREGSYQSQHILPFILYVLLLNWIHWFPQANIHDTSLPTARSLESMVPDTSWIKRVKIRDLSPLCSIFLMLKRQYIILPEVGEKRRWEGKKKRRGRWWKGKKRGLKGDGNHYHKVPNRNSLKGKEFISPEDVVYPVGRVRLRTQLPTPSQEAGNEAGSSLLFNVSWSHTEDWSGCSGVFFLSTVWLYRLKGLVSMQAVSSLVSLMQKYFFPTVC